MTYSVIFLLLVSPLSHQAKIDNAMKLFSKHYTEQISVGEVSKDANILSTGLYSQKGCHCEYSSILTTEAISQLTSLLIFTFYF